MIGVACVGTDEGEVEFDTLLCKALDAATRKWLLEDAQEVLEDGVPKKIREMLLGNGISHFPTQRNHSTLHI